MHRVCSRSRSLAKLALASSLKFLKNTVLHFSMVARIILSRIPEGLFRYVEVGLTAVFKLQPHINNKIGNFWGKAISDQLGFKNYFKTFFAVILLKLIFQLTTNQVLELFGKPSGCLFRAHFLGS